MYIYIYVRKVIHCLAWPDLRGNSVVLSVAVLGIVSAGVHHTGVIDFIFMRHWLELVALVAKL